MNFKYCIFIFCSVFVFAFSSCLEGSDEVVYTYSIDAEILSFQLTRTDIPELSGVLYTIDQIKGEIYNVDSLAYYPEMPQKAKFIYKTLGVYVCLIASDKTDSVQIKSGDSIQISSFINQPKRYIRVYGQTGVKKDYILNLRVHKVDPDSIVYNQMPESLPYTSYSEAKTVLLGGVFYTFANVSGGFLAYSSGNAQDWASISLVGFPANALLESITCCHGVLYVKTTDGLLFQSADGVSWTAVPLGSGYNSVVTILGEIQKSPVAASSLLALVCESSGKNIYVEMDAGQVFSGNIEVDEGFPYVSFGAVSWQKDYASNIAVVGGIDNLSQPVSALWWTQNSVFSWSKIIPKYVQGGDFALPYEAPNAIYYDNKIYLMNGKSDGSYNDKVYYSLDGGSTWKDGGSKLAFPEEYEKRMKASVCVDADNYIYVFGGIGVSGVLNDIWKGRLNKLGFN